MKFTGNLPTIEQKPIRYQIGTSNPLHSLITQMSAASQGQMTPGDVIDHVLTEALVNKAPFTSSLFEITPEDIEVIKQTALSTPSKPLESPSSTPQGNTTQELRFDLEDRPIPPELPTPSTPEESEAQYRANIERYHAFEKTV